MCEKTAKFFLICLILISCSSSKKETFNTLKKHSKADKIIWTAVSYKGTPYKYGGTTEKGMDCSGLVYTAFNHLNFLLPRSSKDMAKKGVKISLKDVKKGDLLFFKTGKSWGSINHVGLVTAVKNDEIFFIHSTSSRGVVITSMHHNYWKKNFFTARRVL